MRRFELASLAAVFAIFASAIEAQQVAAPAVQPPRPTPPKFTKVLSGNAPVDKEGDFVIGPEYAAPPELMVKEGVPVGKVSQFTLDSKDSKFYPGIARDVFGTVDPDNPKTLIVETHPQEYCSAPSRCTFRRNTGKAGRHRSS